MRKNAQVMPMTMVSDLWIPDISILEKIIRTILVYGFLLIALRLGGKRELGQLTGFDLVVLLMFSNAVQNAIIGNDNSLAGGFIGAATLLMTNYSLFAIVEVDFFGTEDLVIFVAFARNEHAVAGLGLGNRRLNSGSAIAHHLFVWQRCGNPFENVVEDALGIFRAGIVGGDDRHISQVVGDFAHLGPLGAIAIAATAKHTDQPTRHKRSRGGQGILQTVRRVGIVHNHAHGLVGTGDDPLHATGHATE
jgi:hypothetical protein